MNISCRCINVLFCISALISYYDEILCIIQIQMHRAIARDLSESIINFNDILNVSFNLMCKVIFIAIKMAQEEYFLIGTPKQRIFGRTPPTLKQLLQFVAFEHMENKKPIRESVNLVIKSAMDIWNQSGSQTIRFDNCVTKLEKEFLDWQYIFRNRHSKTNEQIQVRETFKAKLNLIFDVTPKRIDEETASGSSGVPETESMETEDVEQSASSQFDVTQTEMEASGSGAIMKRPSAMRQREQTQQISGKRLHSDAESESKYSSTTFLESFKIIILHLISN